MSDLIQLTVILHSQQDRYGKTCYLCGLAFDLYLSRITSDWPVYDRVLADGTFVLTQDLQI